MSNSISVNFLQRTGVESKERVRGFYGGVLEWSHQEVHDSLDIYSCGEGITYGIQYLAEGSPRLTDEEFQRATWMSIKAKDRDELISRIKAFGVTELPDQSDDNNFFFQAPGGQVYVC